MRRQRRGGISNDIFRIAAAMPWWAGVVLALVAFTLLHANASLAPPAPPEAAPGTGELGTFAVRHIFGTLAWVGQFVVPPLFLAGALASWMARRKRRDLLDAAALSPTADFMHGLGWRDFERLVGEAFRQRGYSIEETGAGGADGGVDLALRKGAELHLVQCKHWRAFTVPVNVVRELYGVMTARGAALGYVVTSGTFTADAKAFAAGRNIELVDGTALLPMLKAAREGAARAQPAPTRSSSDPPASRSAAPNAESPPNCPTCAAAMVRREARRGGTTGQAFWGCSRFPACRGTRPMAA